MVEILSITKVNTGLVMSQLSLETHGLILQLKCELHLSKTGSKQLEAMLVEKTGSIKKVKTGLVMNQISQDTKQETDILKDHQCHSKTGDKIQMVETGSISKANTGVVMSQTSQATLLLIFKDTANIQLMLNKINSLENMRTQKETIGLLMSQN
jgi:ribosomal protein S17